MVYSLNGKGKGIHHCQVIYVVGKLSLSLVTQVSAMAIMEGGLFDSRLSSVVTLPMFLFYIL